MRERGRTNQLDSSDKAIGRAQPPHPNPLPRGEREPEVPSAKGVIANSTVLGLTLALVIVVCRIFKAQGLLNHVVRLAGESLPWPDTLPCRHPVESHSMRFASLPSCLHLAIGNSGRLLEEFGVIFRDDGADMTAAAHPGRHTAELGFPATAGQAAR